MGLVALVVPLVLVAAACGDTDTAAPDPSGSARSAAPTSIGVERDPWRLLAEGEVEASGSRQVVVGDQEEYVAAWTAVALPGDPPEVDFAGSIVIIRSEPFGSGCEPIFRRLSIREDARTVEPQFVGFEPGHECGADERWYALSIVVRRSALDPPGYTLIGRGEPVPVP